MTSPAVFKPALVPQPTLGRVQTTGRKRSNSMAPQTRPKAAPRRLSLPNVRQVLHAQPPLARPQTTPTRSSLQRTLSLSSTSTLNDEAKSELPVVGPWAEKALLANATRQLAFDRHAVAIEKALGPYSLYGLRRAAGAAAAVSTVVAIVFSITAVFFPLPMGAALAANLGVLLGMIAVGAVVQHIARRRHKDTIEKLNLQPIRALIQEVEDIQKTRKLTGAEIKQLTTMKQFVIDIEGGVKGALKQIMYGFATPIPQLRALMSKRWSAGAND